MKNKKASRINTIPTSSIAQCGMNCRLCHAYTRVKNACPGCRGDDRLKPKTRWACKIKTCETYRKGKIKYCYQCDSYPCSRLKALDKRYKTKYEMSMIDNLNNINKSGIRQFIRNEKKRWRCPGCGGLICVHKPACIYCKYEWR
ncbi:MAG: DUF3795 domain-containing protein [Deltaproteobacteria bacterium]|nr:DUF3795 domain-containing protein [Deltaproteobacteria bacterium]